MKVYKFGGASVKEAESIKNIVQVINQTQFKSGVIVVSAMGKTTNALEQLVFNYMNQKDYTKDIQTVKAYHFDVMKNLFESENPVFSMVDTFFQNLENFLSFNKSTNYNFIYDQVVSIGELVSTTIVSQFFQLKNIENEWWDARNLIKTDANYREGKVDWELTEQNCQKIDKHKISVTQGFIASDPNNFSVTLGREGSDYTAAILSYCLNAESMTIWKDVEGVLNADPRYFPHTQLLEKISYSEAVEMAFYGASVIHPKTLKPLENKEIPFFVKSFLNPSSKGTEITKGSPIQPHIPCYILKQNQVFIEISPKDFSFISEKHVSRIFKILSDFQLKITLMQVSAISLSLCIEDKFLHLDDFINEIQPNFKIQTTQDVSLYTVRHFDDKSMNEISEGKNIILKQIIKETLQIVVCPKI